jgi:SAM-dependent methyltransferase
MNNPQQAHYEAIHDLYADHYYDAESTRYRKQFLYDILFEGLEAGCKRVGDLCCGDGFNTLQLKQYFPSVMAEGFDISPTAVASYNKITGFDGHVADLSAPVSSEFRGKFDILMCVGGVHHCVLNLDMLIQNISSMLRPGGKFVCMEPYASPLMDPIRKLWYRLDPYFDASSERALVPVELEQHGLSLSRLHYGGGPAFYLVNNSMIFRIPKRAMTKSCGLPRQVQAAFRSPSTNTMPSISSCNFALPLSFRQLFCAF